MEHGFIFERKLPDGDIYRVFYKVHFVERYELDDVDHPAVKRLVTEETIRAKIEEAIQKIDDVVYGKSTDGVIVSQSDHFVMLFNAVETNYGRELNMISLSSRVDFRPKSSKEVVIRVNPTFVVRFAESFSFALKVSLLADISDNWKTIERGVMYHLGGVLMDYWLERAGDTFYVSHADWAKELLEIEVS